MSLTAAKGGNRARAHTDRAISISDAELDRREVVRTRNLFCWGTIALTSSILSGWIVRFRDNEEAQWRDTCLLAGTVSAVWQFWRNYSTTIPWMRERYVDAYIGHHSDSKGMERVQVFEIVREKIEEVQRHTSGDTYDRTDAVQVQEVASLVLEIVGPSLARCERERLHRVVDM